MNHDSLVLPTKNSIGKNMPQKMAEINEMIDKIFINFFIFLII